MKKLEREKKKKEKKKKEKKKKLLQLMSSKMQDNRPRVDMKKRPIQHVLMYIHMPFVKSVGNLFRSLWPFFFQFSYFLLFFHILCIIYLLFIIYNL